MKSGRKIYGKLVAKKGAKNPIEFDDFATFGNGELRSLIIYLRGQPQSDLMLSLLGMAMCEVTRRFMAKGKEIL